MVIYLPRSMGGKPTEGLVGITVTSWLIGLKKNVYAQNIRISNDRHLKEIIYNFKKKIWAADDITRRVYFCGSLHSRNEPFDCL